jgi:hypothetical protein
METLFNQLDTMTWTPIILFSVAFLGVLLFIEVMEKQKKDDFIRLNSGRIVKNDYEPLGFNVVVGWVVFVIIAVFYLLYRTYK